MKRKIQRISFVSCLSITVLFSVSSCSISNKQKSDLSYNTEISSYLKYTNEWPEWVKKSIPNYSYGKLFKAEIDRGLHTLHFKEVFQDKSPYESYLNELIQQGWKLETDNMEGFSMKTAFLSMDDFQLTYIVDNEPNVAAIIYSKKEFPK